MRFCFLSVAALVVSLNAGAAMAAAPNAAIDETGALPGGGTYVVHRDVTAPTVAVNLWYRAPSAGYDNTTPGIARLAIASVAASAPARGASLSEIITRVGGSLAINVYPDIAMVGVSVPSWQAAGVIRAITSAYFNPQITANGYKTALRDCAVAAAESQFDSERILQDALFAHLFSAGPAHYAPVPSATQDFSKISSAAALSYAQRAFRASNVTLTITGSVGQQWMNSTALPSLSQASASRSADPPIDSTPSNAYVDVTQIAQVGGVGLAWLGPPIMDPKAATAMDFIADYLFDADHGTVSTALRKQNTNVFVNGQFITLHNPGVLLVTASGASASALRSTIEGAVKSLQQPPDAASFEGARIAFMYHILSQTQTPASQAENLGWYAAEGNLGYAPGDAASQYFQAAAALTPGYVADVARRYLQKAAVVQLITSPRGAAT